MLGIVEMRAAWHFRPHGAQAGITQTLQTDSAGVIADYRVIADQLKKLSPTLSCRFELRLVGEFLEEAGLLFGCTIKKEFLELRLAARVDPIDARNKLHLRLLALANCVRGRSHLTVRADSDTIRHHEIDEFGNSGFFGTGSVIGRNNHLGEALDQPVLIRCKEQRFVRCFGRVWGRHMGGIRRTRKTPAAKSGERCSYRRYPDVSENFPAFEPLSTHFHRPNGRIVKPAAVFADSRWLTMKALLREMVTSSTYRQRSATSPELQKKDPRNRLLARGPQQRLTAEMVRDQALLVSGLLNRTMGGTPVMPPQPPGIWNSVYNHDKWIDAKGPNRYRRAIYTFVKRTSGYPSFIIFDGSDRATSLSRRIPTNTPLQALVTLNDPVYDEAAAALAARTMKEAGGTSIGSSDDRLRFEAQLVLSREPTPQELGILRALFRKTMYSSGGKPLKEASFRSHEGSVGEGNLSPKEFEALKAIGSVLLNLDAALTR